jgi:hypothetical protein
MPGGVPRWLLGSCVVGAAPTGVAVFSRGVGVDGAERAGAELDDEFLLVKC